MSKADSLGHDSQEYTTLGIIISELCEGIQWRCSYFRATMYKTVFS